MTQNLRLRLSATRTLTPEDTNIHENWTPNRNTETTLTERWDQDPEGQKTIRSYYDENYRERGAYYTYSAATAGSGTAITRTESNAPGSICPKGWRLPESTAEYYLQNNEFYLMANEYKGTATFNSVTGMFVGRHQLGTAEPKYVMAGYRDYATPAVMYVSNDAYGWSSTVRNENLAYYLSMHANDDVTPQNSNNRYLGLGMRCVAY